MTALQEGGSWELEVKVGSLQKSNITRAADRDGVTNCNRRVRKMPYHFGVTNGIRMTQAIGYAEGVFAVRGRPSKY